MLWRPLFPRWWDVEPTMDDRLCVKRFISGLFLLFRDFNDPNNDDVVKTTNSDC